MNYASQIILEILEKKFQNDPFYLSEKKEELEAHENKYDALMYLFKLDKETKELFAQKVGVTLEDIEGTLNVLKGI
jgi:hypothetical protein